MVDDTWGRSSVDDARVALLRLLLQVSTILATNHTCRLLASYCEAPCIRSAFPMSTTPQMCAFCISCWHQVEGDRLDVWAAPVGPAAHGGASPYASLGEAAWGRHAATAWQVGV
jgi:hypothetical protein